MVGSEGRGTGAVYVGRVGRSVACTWCRGVPGRRGGAAPPGPAGRCLWFAHTHYVREGLGDVWEFT